MFKNKITVGPRGKMKKISSIWYNPFFTHNHHHHHPPLKVF